jgi:hypothetical protein
MRIRKKECIAAGDGSDRYNIVYISKQKRFPLSAEIKRTLIA